MARGSEKRQIIRLGTAAYEDDLARLAAHRRGGLPPRHFQPLLSLLSEMMDAGSVTIHLTETRHRGLQHFRRHRGRRVVIEVETLHSFHSNNGRSADYTDHRFRPVRSLRARYEGSDSFDLLTRAHPGSQT